MSYQGRRLVGRGELTAADIAAALTRLGLGAGDDVLLHSSMRGLGVIVGGPAAVLDAVRTVIGEEGTLLVPTYSLSGTMLEHLERGGIALDVRSTPSNMGKISETVRTRAGSRRSLHPTHSVSALGPRAEYYCSGHVACSTPCGPGSPFVKLIGRKGWIVALGSSIGKITSYHVLEDRVARFPLSVYLRREFEARVIDDLGRERILRVQCHDPALGPRRIDHNREVEATFERLLAERGVLRVEHVGLGSISAMRADLLEASLEELLEEGITIYGVVQPELGASCYK